VSILLIVPGEFQSLPIPLPDLSHLTQAELAALRSSISAESKEARKTAVKLLGKTPVVKDLWLKSVGLPTATPPEERALIMDPLHRECLRYPETFLRHAWANALCVLDRHIWDEMVKRSKAAEEAKPKKK
jgi:hypothetical protein